MEGGYDQQPLYASDAGRADHRRNKPHHRVWPRGRQCRLDSPFLDCQASKFLSPPPRWQAEQRSRRGRGSGRGRCWLSSPVPQLVPHAGGRRCAPPPDDVPMSTGHAHALAPAMFRLPQSEIPTDDICQPFGIPCGSWAFLYEETPGSLIDTLPGCLKPRLTVVIIEEGGNNMSQKVFGTLDRLCMVCWTSWSKLRLATSLHFKNILFSPGQASGRGIIASIPNVSVSVSPLAPNRKWTIVFH